MNNIIPDNKINKAAHQAEYPKHWLDGYEQEFKQEFKNRNHIGYGEKPVRFYALEGDLGYQPIAYDSQRYHELKLTARLEPMHSWQFDWSKHPDKQKYINCRGIFSDGKFEINDNAKAATPLFKIYNSMMVHGIKIEDIRDSDPYFLESYW